MCAIYIAGRKEPFNSCSEMLPPTNVGGEGTNVGRDFSGAKASAQLGMTCCMYIGLFKLKGLTIIK